MKHQDRKGERYRLTGDGNVWRVFARNAEVDDLWLLVRLDNVDERQEVLGEELDAGVYWERVT